MQLQENITDVTKLYRQKRPGPAVWIAVLVVLAMVGGLGIYFVSQNQTKKVTADTAVLTVAVEPAQAKVIDRLLPVTGSVWPWDPLSTGAEIGGLRIDTVLVDEGDFVKKGQVLATLNSSVLRAALEREQAKVARCRASLEKAKQPNRTQDIASIHAAERQADSQISQEEANVVRAKANLDNAKNNAARYKLLSTQGAVSTQEVESRDTAEKTAAADLRNAEQKLEAAKFFSRQAKERLNIALEGGRKEDVQISQADLSEAIANLHSIEAQITQTIISAPADGLITRRKAHIGDISVANQPLFEMVRDNRFEVRAFVPEQDLDKVTTGEKVDFVASSSTVPPFTGLIREVSPIVDPATRLATARIDVPFHKELRPGMFVHGKAHAGKESVLTVPATALVERDDRALVYVYADEHVMAVPVTVGERVNDVIEVRSGLRPGQQVVTVGAGFLKDGDKVRVGKKAGSGQ